MNETVIPAPQGVSVTFTRAKSKWSVPVVGFVYVGERYRLRTIIIDPTAGAKLLGDYVREINDNDDQQIEWRFTGAGLGGFFPVNPYGQTTYP